MTSLGIERIVRFRYASVLEENYDARLLSEVNETSKILDMIKDWLGCMFSGTKLLVRVL